MPGYQFYNATLTILPSSINFTQFHKIIATMNKGKNREQEQEGDQKGDNKEDQKEAQEPGFRTWNYAAGDHKSWSTAEVYFATSFETRYKNYGEPELPAYKIAAAVAKLMNFVVDHGGYINSTRRYTNASISYKLYTTQSHPRELCLEEFADATYKSQLQDWVEYIVNWAFSELGGIGNFEEHSAFKRIRKPNPPPRLQAPSEVTGYPGPRATVKVKQTDTPILHGESSKSEYYTDEQLIALEQKPTREQKPIMTGRDKDGNPIMSLPGLILAERGIASCSGGQAQLSQESAWGSSEYKAITRGVEEIGLTSATTQALYPSGASTSTSGAEIPYSWSRQTEEPMDGWGTEWVDNRVRKYYWKYYPVWQDSENAKQEGVMQWLTAPDGRLYYQAVKKVIGGTTEHFTDVKELDRQKKAGFEPNNYRAPPKRAENNGEAEGSSEQHKNKRAKHN
ncbi:hypothetical protein HYALB_00011047 [Hymenoscyphus albidus]|uniref:Uncharacterized protein n=1 Tax=Hymenoscyphus albidus TaxID=595503 RepID=A0A9N9Q8T4_9HELO|nr:hypothetical protein HYALB_00011047 [Hymenoscyphus albidus]